MGLEASSVSDDVFSGFPARRGGFFNWNTVSGSWW